MIKRRKNNVSNILWLLIRIHRRIPALIILVLSQIGSAFFSVMFALGSRQVIDMAVAGKLREFGFACLQQGLIILGILVCLTVFRLLKERLNADLDRDWKRDILHSLLQGEYAEVSGYHSAELLNRMNNDVRTVNEGILTVLPSVAGMVTRMVAAMAVMASLEPLFALLVFAAGAVVVVITGLMRRRLKNLNKLVSEHDGKVSGFLQEALEKLLMVQAMDVSDEMERRADSLMGNRYEIQRRRKNVSVFANTCVSVMFYAAGFAALVWCSFGLLKGQMTFGSMTAIIQLVNQLQTPFVNLSGVMPKYIAMCASAERLLELEAVKLQDEVKQDHKMQEALYNRMQGIGGSGLSFSYEKDLILEETEFWIPKGTFTVITGQSGIGKSTLLKLLLGIYRPDSGQMYFECGSEKVLIDRSMRRMFAYVPQGNLLLSGTLRENLTITRPEATEEEIKKALYVSGMDEYINQLPAGLDTVLRESGAGLSEGQAQRLAIGRAILSGAPVLLLDESTSALDEETERRILERIRDMKDRTCIAVTHRPAAVAMCDGNIMIENRKFKYAQ